MQETFQTGFRLIKNHLNDFIGNIQIFAVVSLNFGQLSIGLGIGYSSILIPQLKEEQEIVLEAGQEAWVVSLVALGQIIGSVLGSGLSAGLGRKGGVLLSTVPSITGWCVTAISQNVSMLYVARSFLTNNLPPQVFIQISYNLLYK